MSQQKQDKSLKLKHKTDVNPCKISDVVLKAFTFTFAPVPVQGINENSLQICMIISKLIVYVFLKLWEQRSDLIAKNPKIITMFVKICDATIITTFKSPETSIRPGMPFKRSLLI